MGLLRRPLPEGMVALPPPDWARSGLYLGMDENSFWSQGHMPEDRARWYLDVIWGGQRVVRGVDVTEATALMLAGPGGYKTMGWLLGIVGLQDWPGPVLCLSTRTDLARFAGPRRARLGKVQVLDYRGQLAATLPYQRVKWNPLDGCEVPGLVLDRVKVMYETVELGRPPAEAIWSEGAIGALAAWFHAAAVEGSGIERVLSWQRRNELVEPQRILKHHKSAAGFGENLAALAESAAEQTTQSKLQSTHAVLAALADPAILAGCKPDMYDGFDIDAFLDSADTLFVCDKGGKAKVSPLAPLTVGLVNAILEKAEALAAATPAGPGRLPGRLAKPLLVVIDEVANISPIPALDQVFSQARGHGYTVAIAAQSWGQIVDRWGEAVASAIWDTAAYRLVGAGLQDQDGFLTNVSKTIGEKQEWRKTVGSQSGGSGSGPSHKGRSESHTIMDTPRHKMRYLARLPEGTAILIGREGVRAVQLPALPSLLETLERAEALEAERDAAAFDAASARARSGPSRWSKLRRSLATRGERP